MQVIIRPTLKDVLHQLQRFNPGCIQRDQVKPKALIDLFDLVTKHAVTSIQRARAPLGAALVGALAI